MDISFTEDYDKQCGEVFLTVSGNLVIHCTICEKKFYEFTDYADHVKENHILPDLMIDYVDENRSDVSTLSPNDSEVRETFATLVSEEDMKMFDLEFIAPKPNNCKEIEEYVISMNNGEPVIEQKSVQNSLDNVKNSSHLNKLKNSKPKASTKISNSSTTRYKCPDCDFVSNTRSNCLGHIKRHYAGEKKVKCPICPKAFYVFSELKVHLRFHNKEKNYLCPDCGHTSYTSGALGVHIKTCRNIRDKECTLCGKKFRHTTGLRHHMISHSNKREFHCTVCDSSFKLLKGLKNHMKIHENKKEYECRLCPAKFNQQSGLFSHLKSSHSRANSIVISIKNS